MREVKAKRDADSEEVGINFLPLPGKDKMTMKVN